jgi:DHA1 family bicyclomycin/chloramphenicol resistance-like MFS transporter
VRSGPTRGPSLAALAIVSGVGPFASDTYLAALPELQRNLDTSAAVAQLTLTAFIAGLAVGQLVLGPISDSRGRRRLTLAGALIFTATSLACAVAPSGPALVGFRLVQGVVAGGGMAIGRAVITDRYSGTEAVARFGTLASVTFLAPVAAPALGGAILAVGDWRTVFVVLTGLGVVMVLAAFLGIPETLPAEARHASGAMPMLARMADLLRDRGFMKHVAVQGAAAAGFFTYIGGSSFVLQSAYRISPERFAVVFAGNAVAMVVGSTLFRLLVRRAGPGWLRAAGVALSTSASTGLLVVALLDPDGQWPLPAVWVLLSLVVGGMGLTIPGTTALAQEAGRRSAGTASALQGGIAIMIGASVTPLTGLVGYRTLLPMAAAMAAFFLLSLTLLLLTARPELSGAGSERTAP